MVDMVEVFLLDEARKTKGGGQSALPSPGWVAASPAVVVVVLVELLVILLPLLSSLQFADREHPVPSLRANRVRRSRGALGVGRYRWPPRLRDRSHVRL